MMTSRRYRRLLASAATGLLTIGVLGGCAQATIEAPQAQPSAQTETDAASGQLPSGFAYVSESVPGAIVEARYGTTNNFTGAVVDGYAGPDVAILRVEAAEALAAVQHDLSAQGYGLLIWDAFRPTRAVDGFVAWSASSDQSTKSEYYPDLEKTELFELGYIALESRHSLGGTVDLTIVDAETGDAIDMGGSFDFFGERSHYGATGLTTEQQANRELLRAAMEAHGFEPYALEWWHFSFPLPEGTQPQNFEVSR